MKAKYFLSFGLIVVLTLSLFLVHQTNAMTLTVNTTSDEHDGSCADGDCSLRDAIIIANTNPGPDTININIPMIDVGCMDGICYLYPNSALPALTGDGTIINGYYQPGSEEATIMSPAVIKIEIDGRNLTDCPNVLACNGLIISSSGNTVQGLSIHSFAQNGIAVASLASSAPAETNVIKGNYIGVSHTGTSAPGNGWVGVYIGGYAENNTVGGYIPGHRNVISGNGTAGVGSANVEIWGQNAFNNHISGNYIGSDHTGSASLSNEFDGVRIYGGAHNNTIGGGSAVDRNIIVGNERSGVRIVGTGTNENAVSSNYIGVDKAGLVALGNVSEGVFVGQGAQLNQIGGDAYGEGNLISGNLDSGVILSGTNTMSNTVSGNYIGINWNGSAALGNSGSGIYISTGASYNIFGGDTQAERNYISGNYNGISIYGDATAENVVIGNYIGTNISGFGALPNTNVGIAIASGAHHNRIGGESDSELNLISGNSTHGIFIFGAITHHNSVLGNFIGTDTTGMGAVGNGSCGVMIMGAVNNTIGGSTLGTYNIISGNDGYGVSIILSGADNTIAGNIIGLSDNLEEVLPNGSSGIYISGAAHNNLIGGSASDIALNYIAANNGDGVHINGLLTDQNTVAGNAIGFPDMGNLGAGVVILNGAKHNTIGGSQDNQNFIGFNHQYGIALTNEGTDSNVISYNSIRMNTLGGVLVSAGEDNRIGPSNTIANNGADGVWIVGPTTTGNMITENTIGTNVNSGIDLEAGANGGILAPAFTAQGPFSVSGTACSGCTVELFANGDLDGEGWIYLNKATSDASGNFSFTFGTLVWPNLTATATDPSDGTSEFSANFVFTNRFLYLPVIRR